MSDQYFIDSGEEHENDLPAIYTSEDETDPLNPRASRKAPSDGNIAPQNESNQSEIGRRPNAISLSPLEPVPTKRARLPTTASLVSYTVDDEDDDDKSDSSEHPDHEANEFESDQESLTSKAFPNKHKPDLVRYSLNPESMLEIGEDHSDSSRNNSLLADFHESKSPIRVLSAAQLLEAVRIQDEYEKRLILEQQEELQPADPIDHFMKTSEEVPYSSESKQEEVSGKPLSDDDRIRLPSEPPGHCPMRLQNKVDREVNRMRVEIDYDPNRAIQDNKAFRNPSIYEKLISFLNIDEKGTNFPKDVYDPYRWAPESYYDELARVQNREIDRLNKLVKEQKKVDTPTTASGGAVGGKTSKDLPPSGLTKASSQPVLTTFTGVSVATGFAEPKRKSKWDAGILENLPPSASSAAFDNGASVGSLVKES